MISLLRPKKTSEERKSYRCRAFLGRGSGGFLNKVGREGSSVNGRPTESYMKYIFFLCGGGGHIRVEIRCGFAKPLVNFGWDVGGHPCMK